MLTAGVNLSTLDIRAIAFRASSTIPDDHDAVFLTDFVAFAECDASGYARFDYPSTSLVEDTVGDLIELHLGDADFGTLIGGSEEIGGFLLYVHLGADSANRPFAVLQEMASGPGLPYSAVGQPVRLLEAATGSAHF